VVWVDIVDFPANEQSMQDLGNPESYTHNHGPLNQRVSEQMSQRFRAYEIMEHVIADVSLLTHHRDRPTPGLRTGSF